MKKNIFILIFIIIFITCLKSSFCSLENITNIKYYVNQICSYNGIPVYDKNISNSNVTCICEEQYDNEPREEKKRYVNGQLIQCSYRKKKRFKAFFLAAITPFGINYCYLEQYAGFAGFLIFGVGIIVLNFISMVLNYKLEKKNEESKRQLKLKKSTNKFDIRNLAEINDRCVKNFNLAAKILLLFMIGFWFGNVIVTALGYIKDYYEIDMENDMGYIFRKAER